MTLKTFETATDLANASVDLILQALKEKPTSLCCFAAGFTQNETYEILATKLQNPQLKVIGLDEWEGLNGTSEGSCRHYMDTRMFTPLGIQPLHYFDGKQPLAPQCAVADQLLDEHGPIDILILGVGMNGHLGFNEPGVNPQNRTHVQPLDATTQQVGSKYFEGQAPPTAGITLGLKDLLQAKLILLQIVGEHKAPILQQLMAEGVDPNFPASYLKDTNAYVFTDIVQ